jgi:3-methyladenine DNA glycosylase AlkC
MAWELRNWFDAAFFRGLAGAVAGQHAAFDRRRFVREATDGLEALSIMERLDRTADLLGRHLPPDYATALGIVMAVVPHYDGQFRALFGPTFVARHGRHDRRRSLPALRRMTRHGSSEFAIRPFLVDDLDGTLAVMRRWAGDRDHHVRRLASEGCRPRLPWSFRLERLVADPTPAFPILETLKADPEDYVRRSVANHLNDVAKDHPDLMLDLVEGWDGNDPATAWVVRHACRSLVKAGHPRALALLGFGARPEVAVRDLTVTPATVPWQGTVAVAFDLVSRGTGPQRLAVDYVLHYVKANGSTAPKVFKLREVDLEAGATQRLAIRRSLQERTTRRHYPGGHRVDIQVNGTVLASAPFTLLAP